MSQMQRPRPVGWTRRDFLKLNAGAIGALALAGPWVCAAPGELLREIEVLRPHDLFAGRIRFVNCGVKRLSAGFGLRRFSESAPAYILLELPSQHLVEDGSYLEFPPPEPLPGSVPREFVDSVSMLGPVKLRMAGPSVLVWELNEEDFKHDIPFRLSSLLDKVGSLPLRVRPVGDKNPFDWETRIEWPYRLWLAPWPNQRMYHLGRPHARRQLFSGADWVWEELWHTGLDLRPKPLWKTSGAPVLSLSQPPRADANSRAELLEGPVTPQADPRGVLQTLAVRGKNDFPFPDPKLTGDELNDPGRLSPYTDSIFAPPLVQLENLNNQLHVSNGVLRAKQLLLTSLGASGDVEYRAQVNLPGALRIWNQRTAIGRDNYIRVVTNGFLMPFQHQAVFVQIWERKLARVKKGDKKTKPSPSGDELEQLPTAALILRRQFIVVLEPEKFLPADDSTGHPTADRLAREQHFIWVRIKDERTPNLAKDKDMMTAPYVFWPVPISNGEGGEPFRFQCEGRDRAGRLTQFTQSFLYAEDLESGGAKYDTSPDRNRTAYLPQQPMAFAPESAVPLTAADVNPTSLGWIRQLVEDARPGSDAALLLGGGVRASAALAGLRAAAEGTNLAPMDQQTLVSAHLEDLFGANDLNPAKLRRALVDPLLRLLPEEEKIRDWLEVPTKTNVAVETAVALEQLLAKWKAAENAAMQSAISTLAEKCAILRGMLEKTSVELKSALDDPENPDWVLAKKLNPDLEKLNPDLNWKEWKKQQRERALRSIRQTLETFITDITRLAEARVQGVLDEVESGTADLEAQARRALAATKPFIEAASSVAYKNASRDVSEAEAAKAIVDAAEELAQDWARRRTGFLQSLDRHLDNLKDRQDALLDTLEDLSALVPEVRDWQTKLLLDPKQADTVLKDLREQRHALTQAVSQCGTAVRLKQTLLISAIKSRITDDWIKRLQQVETILKTELTSEGLKKARDWFNDAWAKALLALDEKIKEAGEDADKKTSAIQKEVAQFLDPLRGWTPLDQILQKTTATYSQLRANLAALALPADGLEFIALWIDFFENWNKKRTEMRRYFAALEADELGSAWETLLKQWKQKVEAAKKLYGQRMEIAEAPVDQGGPSIEEERTRLKKLAEQELQAVKKDVCESLARLREALKDWEPLQKVWDGRCEDAQAVLDTLLAQIPPLFKADAEGVKSFIVELAKDAVRAQLFATAKILADPLSRKPFATVTGWARDLEQVFSDLAGAWSRLTATTDKEDHEIIDACAPLWGPASNAPSAIASWPNPVEGTAAQQREAIEALRNFVLAVLRRTSEDWPRQQQLLLKILLKQRTFMLRLLGLRLPVRPPDPALFAREIRFKINNTVRKLGADGLNALERQLPRIEEALAEVPALKRISPDLALARLRPFEDFIDHGFARLQHGVLTGVRNGVYAEFVEPLNGVGQQLQAGVMRPVMQFAGLSREAGALIGHGRESLREVAKAAQADLAKVAGAAQALKKQLEGELKSKLEGLLDKEEAKRITDAVGSATDELKKLAPLLQAKRARFNEARQKFEAAQGEAVAVARRALDDARRAVDELERKARTELEKFERARRRVEFQIAGHRAAAEQLLEKELPAVGATIDVIQQQVEQALGALRELATYPALPAKIQGKIKELTDEANAFLGQLRQHVEAHLDQRVTEVQRSIANLEARLVNAIEAEREQLLAQVRELRAKFAPLKEQIAAVEARAADLRKNFNELKSIDSEQWKQRIQDEIKAEAEKHIQRAKDEAGTWLKEQAGKLDIEKWVPQVKLLGSLDLSKLLAQINDFSKLPQIVSRDFPDRVEVAWNWETLLEPRDFGLISFEPKGARQFRLASLARTDLPRPGRKDVPPPQSHLNGQIDAFEVVLAKCIRLRLDRLTFESGTGRSTRITPHGLKVGFEGPLAFVAKLEEFLRKLTGAKGLSIRLLGDRVEVGLSLSLRPLTFGAFSLTNIRLTTWLGVPLADGVMSYKFSFCERDAPFLLTVSTYAGGGFLTLGVDSDGGRLIEGALEFGGVVALNLGAAVGSVQVMGGFYFCSTREAATASGYLRIAGYLSVLGFIEVSVEIVLGLTYQREGGQSVFAGYAMLRVSVKIGFFKKSFTFRVYRKFAGAGGGSSQNQDSASLFAPRTEEFLALADLDEAPLLASGRVCEKDGDGARPGTQPAPSFKTARLTRADWRRYRAAFAA